MLSSGDYWGDFDYCDSWKYYCDSCDTTQIVDNLSMDTFYTALSKLSIVKQTIGDSYR